jgi:hypothetical protein
VAAEVAAMSLAARPRFVAGVEHEVAAPHSEDSSSAMAAAERGVCPPLVLPYSLFFPMESLSFLPPRITFVSFSLSKKTFISFFSFF